MSVLFNSTSYGAVSNRRPGAAGSGQMHRPGGFHHTTRGFLLKDLDQTFRIKRLLAERGETITSLALKLARPFGSVANNIYGYRVNRSLQEEIAGFLGLAVEELFNHQVAPEASITQGPAEVSPKN